MKNDERPEQVFDFAAIAAHQMRAPVAAISTILDVLAGEYAGPVTPKQRELLDRANDRCREALDSLKRILSIAAAAKEAAEGKADLVKVLLRVQPQFQQSAAASNIRFTATSNVESAWVAGMEAALHEVVNSLLANALKYTPDNGRVEMTLDVEDGRGVVLTVGDSGVGVPEDERGKIFHPFYRGAGATGSSRPGLGLGLAFVKTVVDRIGGVITVGKSALGGAEFVVELPSAKAPEKKKGVERMAKVLKVVVVGGVAAGPKVASKIIRLVPDADVTIVEKGEFLSYAGCGLPYYVSGIVKEHRELMSTPVGVVRDSVFFQKVKNVRVLNRTEAVEIDRAKKRVRVKAVVGGEESWLEYDKLALCTGAVPAVPAIPGVELEKVFMLHGVKDAEGIRAALAQGKAHDVVIVGGGLIGVEVTEALVSRGCRVTIVEMLPQLLRMLDWEIARLVEQHLESQGVKVLTNTKVDSLAGEGRVTGVVTSAGTLPADMVILGIGVRPNVQLARDAGLEIGETKAIKVDEHMRTSDPDIYAAGDCVESLDMITGRPTYVPLGSTANKQGRVAAINICGGHDTFPGVLGSTICKVFEFAVARTGLTESAARKLGYDVVTALAPAIDRADYMPNAKRILMKLVADRKSRMLLGAQAVGPGSCDKRMDIAAMALTAKMTLDQLANADLCYAPPYSPAMDNIITAANVARNKIDGHMNGISPIDVHEMMEKKEDFVLLDVRTPGEVERVRLAESVNVPLGALRGRMGELPKDKRIVTFCSVSLRAYEAGLILKAAGFDNVWVMDGGLTMWPFEKIS